MIVSAILKFISEVFGKLLIPLTFYFKGRSDVNNKTLKENNKRLSNRPRDLNDRVNRLRKWRDKLSKD